MEETSGADTQVHSAEAGVSLDTSVAQVTSALQVRVPAPVLAVYGRSTAEHADPGRLASAVAAAAARTGAIILDAGGLLAGGGALDDGAVSATPGLQIACRHGDALARRTHLVLGDGEAPGEELRLLLELARALAHGLPLALLVVGADEQALAEAARARESGFSVLAVADGRQTALQTAAGRSSLVVVDSAQAQSLTHALVWALHPDLVLKDAWRLFTMFDGAAVRMRARFEHFQVAILVLGLLATLLALLARQIGTDALRWAVVGASVAVAGLTALSGRRAAGKRWIVTRAAAESVKSEIYRYRTGTGRYSDGRAAGRDHVRPAQALAGRLGEIERRLMHTEVGNGALPADEKPGSPLPESSGDDGLRALGAEEYVTLRVSDQLAYYHRRLADYDRRRRVLQAIAVLASSAGAVVAGLGGQVWVALTSALAAAPLAYLAQLQVERTIVTYNQSVASLDDVLRRWHARAARTPTRQAFARLVDATEATLTAEHGAWVEEMTEAMHNLDDHEPEPARVPDAAH